MRPTKRSTSADNLMSWRRGPNKIGDDCKVTFQNGIFLELQISKAAGRLTVNMCLKGVLGCSLAYSSAPDCSRALSGRVV